MMKATALATLIYVSLVFSPTRAAMTVVDFEDAPGGNLTPFPASFHGLAFSPDFGTWIVGHSGGRSALANCLGTGWKECTFTFTNRNQKFLGAWVLVYSNTLELRMYLGGKMVAKSATVGETFGRTGGYDWAFLPSGYDGEVDTIGVWAYRGQYGIDDIAYSALPVPAAPRRAEGIATVVDGRIAAITVLDPGFGYRTAPRVILIDARGTNAIAVARVANESVQSVTIEDGGIDYTASPIVKFGLPDFTAGMKISVSKIKVEMTLEVGHRYLLYSSSDLKNWNPVGDAFTATSETKVSEFDVQPIWLYYRLQRID